MDRSEKYVIELDHPTEEPERDEKYSEIEETREICEGMELMLDAPGNSSMERKCCQCFESQRKKNTDIVREESAANLTDCSNLQDSIVDNSKGNVKLLRPVTLPHMRKTSIEEDSNRADQSKTEEYIETSEETHSIKASIHQYFSGAFEESGSDPPRRLVLENTVCTISNGIINILENLKGIILKQENETRGKPVSSNIIHSKDHKNYVSDKYGTKVAIKNQFVKEQLADDKEPHSSKLEESEEMCLKCNRPLHPSIISPTKRKSEQRIEEIKRMRSADFKPVVTRNVENVTDGLGAQNATLYADFLMKLERNLINIVVSDNTVERIEKQAISINQTDQSDINYKITETTSGTDFESREMQASNKTYTSGQTLNSDRILLLKVPDVSPTRKHSILQAEHSFTSIFQNVKTDEIETDPTSTNGNEYPSEGNPTDPENEDIATENVNKFQGFPETRQIGLGKIVEEKSMTFPSKMTSSGLSDDMSLENYKIHLNEFHPNQTAASTSKFEAPYIGQESERTSKKELPRRQLRKIGGVSPVKLFSNLHSGLNPIYNEPGFINWKCIENDPEIIQGQKRILESIYLQKQHMLSMTVESENEEKENLPKPPKMKGGLKVPPEIALKVYTLVEMLIEALEYQGKNPNDFSRSELYSQLVDLAKNYAPDTLPHINYVTRNYREYMKESPAAIRNAFKSSIKDVLDEKERILDAVVYADHSRDTLGLIQNSPDSPPPQNEPNKIPNTDSLELLEQSKLDEEPIKGVKDTRYLKKYYKRKNPVTLPSNADRDKASVSKNKQKVQSEEKLMQTADDDQRIACKNSEDSGRGANPKFILKDAYIEKEKEKSPEGKLSGTAEMDTECKSSFIEESPKISQSDSRRKNECKLPPITERTHQPEILTASCVFSANLVPCSQAEITVKNNETKEKVTSENIIDSKSGEMYTSSRDNTEEIDENLSGKKCLTDNELSTLLVHEKTCTKCQQDILCTPILSPRKRKSEEITEDEKKQKRSDKPIEEKSENLTDTLNVQDPTMYTDHLKKHEKQLSTQVSVDNTIHECFQQDIAINQSPVKYNRTKTTGEIDFETYTIQTSKSESTPNDIQNSGQILLSEDADVNLTRNCSISFVERNLLSPFQDNAKDGEITNLSNELNSKFPSEDRLNDSKIENTETKNVSKFQDFSQKCESEFPNKEDDKLENFPYNMRTTNVKLSPDISIHMSQCSAESSKSQVLNIIKNHENTSSEETLLRHAEFMRGLELGHTPSVSPIDLISDEECNLNPIFNEPESKIINVEQMENDPEFIRKQNLILESISSQQQVLTSIKPESDNKGEQSHLFKKPSSKELDPKIPNEDVLRVFALIEILADNFKSRGININDFSNLELIFMVLGLAQTYDLDSIPNIPYVITNYREYIGQSPTAILIAYERFKRSNSQAGPSRSPSSQPGPSRSPSSQPGPSRSPSSQPGPSRSPSSQPGPSRSPSSQAVSSQTEQ